MLSRFRPEDDVEHALAAYQRDGAVIIEDLLEPSFARQLLADFEPHLAAEPWCNRDHFFPAEYFGVTSKRLHGLFRRSPRFSAFAGHPWLDSACRKLLGEYCRDHRIAITELIEIGPQEKRQPLHRDSDAWSRFPKPRSEIMVVVILALTDFTEMNGSTLVVPGSHLWPTAREATEDEITRATMTPGSALFFSGDVLHSGGANETSASRIGAYVGYSLGWLCPLEQHVLTNGLDAVRHAPRRVRELLGYVDAGWVPGM